MIGRALLLLALLLVPFAAQAQEERVVRLAAPEALVQSGLLNHILPRFSLKTQVKVQVVASGEAADVALGDEGKPMFDGLEQTWSLAVLSPDHAASQRFADWLGSEVGRNAVTGFAPEGAALFTLPQARAVKTVQASFDGDADLGLKAAERHCKRCHAVSEKDRFGSIGSTPSFMVLRAMPDWDSRFAAFYTLNPHPAFTQVDGVTDPFPENRPSPIAPIDMTLEEVEAILAFVQGIKAADLGAPVQSR